MMMMMILKSDPKHDRYIFDYDDDDEDDDDDGGDKNYGGGGRRREETFNFCL